MAYKVLYGSSIESLEREMIRHLNDRWEPLGGVSVGEFERGVFLSSNYKERSNKVQLTIADFLAVLHNSTILSILV